jgi:hypothetical protein
VRHRRRHVTLPHLRLDRRGAERLLALHQPRQGGPDLRLALPRRRVQDLEVLLGGAPRLLLGEPVVGGAEARRREQLGPVAVVGERPRLADQGVDHVAVVDLVLALAAQPRHLLDRPLRVMNLDLVRGQPDLDPLADQPAGHRVGVAQHVDGAAAVHAHLEAPGRLQAGRRQPAQQRQLLVEALLAALVELAEQRPQEAGVLIPALEVAAAAEHQRLAQGALEAVVALLAVAVLVRLPDVDGLRLQAVVPQQGLVALRELLVAARRHGGTHAVGAVELRHAAELPQGVLQALGQALVALREADGAGLPVGVGQHEVIDHVVERLAADGDAEVAAAGEVAGAEAAGVVDLVEEHLLLRPLLCAPGLDAALQGAELAVGEAPGEAALQVFEQRLGLQAGVEFEALGHLGPELGEGVGARAPVSLHDSDLAGQPPQAAVLAGGLGGEARFVGGQVFGQALGVEPEEAADLLVGDHPEPPCLGGSG